MASSDLDGRVKRKREAKIAKPNKKSRSSPDAEDSAEDEGAKILLMEKGILESRKNYNDISVLLGMASSQQNGPEESMLATVALCRVFMRMLAQGTLNPKKGASEKDQVVFNWLKAQYTQYKAHLTTLLKDEDLASTALTLSMRLLKAEGEHLDTGEEHSFPWLFLESVIGALLEAGDEDVCKTFIEDYAEQYDDVRYFTFKALKRLVENTSASRIPQNALFDRAYALLKALDGVPENASELEDFYTPRPQKKTHPLLSITKHKMQGQNAWLAILRITESTDQRKKILDVISTVVAPWFMKPELLADFLTSSYDSGGSISLLALSGVFYLIQERNLDYPSFYTKLYSLLDRDILHSKHRSRFFRLMDTFLASTHLPAALVASFLKRLSRLSLNAPPSAIVFLVPWFYNTLKRHPLCTFMMHREIRDPEMKRQIAEQGAADPFDPEEADPIRTGAIDSCLWEIVQLQSHYHPNVATIAKIISEQFTKQSYNPEDFLDHSYASLLDAELGREVKKAPVVEFQIPKRVFLPQDKLESDHLVTRLWDFSSLAGQSVTS